MNQPWSISEASLGDQRIARRVKRMARLIGIDDLDREDFVQDVHAELCEGLGDGYRERLGVESSEFWASEDGKTLRRCVDRVKKRITRRWKRMRRAVFDQCCLDETEDASASTDIVIFDDELPEDAKQVLSLLKGGMSDERIQKSLKIGRTKLYHIKKRLYLNLMS